MSDYFDNKQLFSTPQVSQYGNHMVMTNVIKETKKKYINIDTQFSDDYATNKIDPSNNTYNLSNYTFILPEKITNVKSMMVLNAEIPVTYYNISSVLGNNYFRIRSNFYDNFSTIITIPDGYYTLSSLVDKLNNVFAANQDRQLGLLCSIYNNQIIRFFMNQSSGFFYIDFAITPTGDFDKYNFKSKFGWTMGFRSTTIYVNGEEPEATISPNPVNLYSPKYMYLAIDEFSKTAQNSFISPLAFSLVNKKIIAKISMDNQFYPFGTLQISNRQMGLLMSDKRSYNGKTDIQKLLVQLIDEKGNPVNLNGADFSFSLEIEYE
jgi:hypothetical protein